MQKSILDIDLNNPFLFEVAISTYEATRNTCPSKNKKSKMAHV